MNSRFHYRFADLEAALHRLGLRPGDTVFGHSNLGFFGIPAEGRDQATICAGVLEVFQRVLGDQGTLVVPTFSYSFPRGEPFDPAATPSTCGVFTEYVRRLPQARRSLDPIVSVAAVGARAEELTASLSDNSYDENSFFARFLRAEGRICNMNLDAGSTFIHYVERMLQVPYRFDKRFAGTLLLDGEARPASQTIWVRYLSSDDTVAEFTQFDTLARSQGLFREEPVGRGAVGLIDASAVVELIRTTLPARPWFLTRAGLTGSVPKLIPEEP